MDKATLPTPAQQKLLSFFSPVELSTIQHQLKEIFRVAAFESEIALNDGGRNSLFTLYYLIELLDELREAGKEANHA